MIDDFNKSNKKGENINKKIRILNELRTLKKAIMFNYKEHPHYEKSCYVN